MQQNVVMTDLLSHLFPTHTQMQTQEENPKDWHDKYNNFNFLKLRIVKL